MQNHITLGQRGEAIAKEFLKKAGFKILECNWRYGKGEVDIIASIENYVVFVEVKTRSTDAFGDPEESIGKKKMRQLFDVADRYMEIRQVALEARFDLITVIIRGDDTWSIEHIPDAYYPFMNI